jgi:hypothetical protein
MRPWKLIFPKSVCCGRTEVTAVISSLEFKYAHWNHIVKNNQKRPNLKNIQMILSSNVETKFKYLIFYIIIQRVLCLFVVSSKCNEMLLFSEYL